MHDRELDGLVIAGDRAERHVGLRQVDRDTGLRPNEYRAGLRRSHLLHRLSAAGRKGLEKRLYPSLDACTTCAACRHRPAAPFVRVAVMVEPNRTWTRRPSPCVLLKHSENI